MKSLSANDREAKIVRHGINEIFIPASLTSLLLELLAILSAPFGFGNLETIYWKMSKTEGKKRFRFKMLIHIKNNCVTRAPLSYLAE